MRFLFVDRITTLTPGTLTRGIKHVTPDDFYLMCDETGRRAFMPALVGETVGQLAAWNVMFSTDFTKRPVAGIAERACLHRPVYVGETLQLESYVESLDDTAMQYHGKAMVGDELVFELMGALGPMLPMEDFIAIDAVRRQFDELNQGYINEDDISKGAPLCEANAKALLNPHALALTEFDHIVGFEAGVSIEAQKCVTRAAPYFADHFPRKPVLPMTILLECLMGLSRAFIEKSSFDVPYRVLEMRRIKMNDFVTPGDVLHTKLSVKSHTDDELVLRCRVSRFEKRVCVLEIVMAKAPVNE